MVPATPKSQFVFNYLKKDWSWSPLNVNEIRVWQQKWQCNTISPNTLFVCKFHVEIFSTMLVAAKFFTKVLM